jgi:endonuclease VIII
MEGPSLVILKEELEQFRGQKILKVTGNTKQPKESLTHRTLQRIETWGKQLFLTFSSPARSSPPIITKTHFLMFGSYRINDPKPERSPRLELKFRTGLVDFYACSIQFGVDVYLQELDRRVDLMSERWDEAHVVDLMGQKQETFLCDLFLNQDVFAGSGNIVKNEVLFNIRRHPLTKLVYVPRRDWPRLAQAVHEYCWNFYVWKKQFQLRRHWQVYRQKNCPLCDSKLVTQSLGKFARRTFYCPKDQALQPRVRKLVVFPVLPVGMPNQQENRLEH